MYVKSGSDINLTCKISQGPHDLGNIFWYKGKSIKSKKKTKLNLKFNHKKKLNFPQEVIFWIAQHMKMKFTQIIHKGLQLTLIGLMD